MTQPPSPNRRAFLGSLMAVPLLTAACRKTYDRYFTIEWDEEVALHNGRIIIVHIKRTFERVTGSMLRSRWNGMERAIEIDFDAGGEIGRYKRKFDGYDINYIHTYKGNWYILLAGLSIVPNRIVKQDMPVWILTFNGVEKAAENWSEIPHFPSLNVMPITPSSEGISQFNKKLLTIPIKMAHWKKFPRAAGDDGIARKASDLQPLPE